MRTLTVSLLLVIVVSIFGLGWALDALFARFSRPPVDVVEVITTIGRDSAVALNSMADPMEYIKNSGGHYPVSLTPIADFSLPESLMSGLKSGEAIVLESDQGLSINYFLSAHDRVYTLDSIPVIEPGESWIKVIFTSIFYLGTLSLVLIWLLPLLRRLNLLRKASVEFGEGDLGSRVNLHGISYIADIEREYNRMADKIQSLVEDNKLLSSAVSHDLRTPLARLRFGVDTLAETEHPRARAEYQKRVSSDLDEMESLIDSLLRYARMDSVMDEVPKEAVSIVSLCQQCVAHYADEEVSVTLDYDGLVDSDQVYGSIEHLGSMMNNLIHNAVEHAASRVLVRVERDSGLISVSVADDGNGLDAVKKEQLLKPFQRGDDSVGYGLGLAIVARIAAHHRTELVIGQSEKLGGAKFSVKLPALSNRRETK